MLKNHDLLRRNESHIGDITAIYGMLSSMNSIYILSTDAIHVGMFVELATVV